MKRITQLKNKLIITAVYVAVLIIFWALKIPCIYRHFLSVPCPGCGMSRAVFALFRLDLASAFSYHPCVFAMPVLYLYFLFDGKLFNRKIIDYSVMFLIAAGFLINWVVNLW